MKNKLISLWKRLFPDPVDTTPEHFDAWFQNKIGQGLRGGEVYFAIREVGSPKLPTLNKKFQLFKELENAERFRKELQRDNPGIILEVVIARAFYSFPEVS